MKEDLSSLTWEWAEGAEEKSARVGVAFLTRCLFYRVSVIFTSHVMIPKLTDQHKSSNCFNTQSIKHSHKCLDQLCFV